MSKFIYLITHISVKGQGKRRATEGAFILLRALGSLEEEEGCALGLKCEWSSIRRQGNAGQHRPDSESRFHL